MLLNCLAIAVFLVISYFLFKAAFWMIQPDNGTYSPEDDIMAFLTFMDDLEQRR